MNHKHWIALLGIYMSLALLSSDLYAQTRTYDFKKGEVIYLIIALQRKEVDTKDLFKEYRQDFFPMAEEYSYVPFRDGSLAIGDVLRGGNTYDAAILGKWTSPSRRKAFAQEIYKVAPNFDQRRREIWYAFDQITYEAQSDMTITIRSDRYNVLTAIWCERSKKCQSYARRWQKTAEQYGGEISVRLTDGSTPSGYYYDPDVLILSEWPDKQSYEGFAAALTRVDASCVVNINEFELK